MNWRGISQEAQFKVTDGFCTDLEELKSEGRFLITSHYYVTLVE
jgi:hypothetical protein